MRPILRFAHGGVTDPTPRPYEAAHRALSRRAAAESMVLLKNDGLLPLRGDERVALLGAGADHTLMTGSGSGEVNVRDHVTITQGLREAGFSLTSEGWLADYAAAYDAARQNWRSLILSLLDPNDLSSLFAAYSTNPFQMPAGRPLAQADVAGADAAVYVCSRIAGEGADRQEFALTEMEHADLRFLNEHKVPTILILNIGGPVALGGIANLPFLKAILFTAQPGQEGGRAVADVLTGRVNPSGRLTDTWAIDYNDYPCADEFSFRSPDPGKQYYREGIYMGYRYFDTFGVRPRYCFGFGLSYTTFHMKLRELRADESGFTAAVSVTNTGSLAGREVVQLYASCPQTGLPKEFRRLVGFAKTALLEPGQSETVTIPVPAKALASFRESDHTWLCEKGLYGLWVGDSLEGAVLRGALSVEKDALLETVAPICPLRESLEEFTSPRNLLNREDAWHAQIREEGLPVLPFAPAPSLPAVPGPDDTDREAFRLSESLPLERLLPLLYGDPSLAQEIVGSPLRVPGVAAETTLSLADLGIPSAILADGPAGIRIRKTYEVDRATDQAYNDALLGSMEDGFFGEPISRENADVWYQYCTAFPSGILLSQSFDTALLEEIGRAVGEEMGLFHVSWWLAPGMNLHRNPLCGRNFEYYSEDPLVSGLMAAAVTVGVQGCPGTGTTIKHFACNNSEFRRMSVDCVLSERALRELYLRGFEIAVKTAQPMCVMTSYNLLNGVHTANSRDLCTTVLREEWGFRGLVMTDWTTTGTVGGSTAWKCLWAGNDLMMPGLPSDAESVDNALRSGELSVRAVRSCARRILNVLLRTNAFEGSQPYGKEVSP